MNNMVEMISYDQALKYVILGESVFITGSGFSLDAYNNLNDDNNLWLAGKLASQLSQKVDMDDDTPLDIVSQEYIDLYGESKMIEYLKDHFTVMSYAEYYKSLTRIRQLKVFSTNYDDLIEKVYEDDGMSIDGLDVDCDIRNFKKDRLVFHLNGYIRNLDDCIPDSFKLTHLSYNNTSFFDSPWYSYFIGELYSARAIFVIGLSFDSDLDLRRIISDDALKEKTFIIQREDLSESKKKYLEKYGRVLLCGIANFLKDIGKTDVSDYVGYEKRYKSFERIPRHAIGKTVEGRDLYDLFFYGVDKDEVYDLNGDRCFTSLVNRREIGDIVSGLRKGNSFIVHAELGNGKSVFVNQIIDLCSELNFYRVKQMKNNRIENEIKRLCNSEKISVVVFDPANVYIDIFKKFRTYDLENVRFLLVMRSPMYDNLYDELYNIIDKMKNVSFVNPINVDILGDEELDELDDIIVRQGFYGQYAGESKYRRIDILKNKCGRKFQNILLYIFKSEHIIRKFENSLNSLNKNKTLRGIVALAFVSDILELGLTTSDFKVLYDLSDIERIIRRSGDCSDIIEVRTGDMIVKSSIVAKELMSGTDIFSKDEVFNALIIAMEKLDKLYLGNPKYFNAMKNLVSCSYLSYVFGYDVNSSLLIDYYDKVKELSFNKRNLFFWEQYAIACVNLKKYDRAETYFETAYSYAKKRGGGFSTYQIDNHYARCILEKQLFYRQSRGSIDVFVKAHNLLSKPYYKNGDVMDNRYYKYRVANAYKEYYDAFFDKYDKTEKEIFLSRVKEMYFSLQKYKQALDGREMRKDVYECEAGLKSVLNNEGVF